MENKSIRPVLTLFVLFGWLAFGSLQAQKKGALIKEGNALIDQELKEEAYDMAQAALKADPEDAEALAIRGVVYVMSGYAKSAKLDLKFATEHKSKNPKAYANLALIYMEDGKWTAARECLEAGTKLDKNDLDVLRIQAMWHLYKEELPQCLEVLKKLSTSGQARGSFLAGRLYLDLDMGEEALKCLNKALPDLPARELTILSSSGICHLELGDRAAAQRCFDRIMELDEEFYPAFELKFKIVQKDENWEELVQVGQKLVEIAPQYSRSNHLLAFAWMKIHRMDSAAFYFVEANSLPGGRVFETAYVEGKLLGIRGENEDAANALAFWYSKCPQDKSIRNDYGLALVLSGQGEEGLRILNEQVELGYANAHTYLHFSTYYAQVEDSANQRLNIRKCMELDSTNAAAYFLMGSSLMKFDENEAAMPYLQLALDRGSGDSAHIFAYLSICYISLDDTINAQKNLNLALLLWDRSEGTHITICYTLNQLGRYAEGLEYGNRAMQEQKPHPYMFFNRGVALFHLGKYEEAIEDFDTAERMKHDYKHWPPHYRGNAFRELNRYQEALQQYNISLEHDPDFADCLTDRGILYLRMGEKEKARADFEHALEIKPKYAAAKAQLDLLDKNN